MTDKVNVKNTIIVIFAIAFIMFLRRPEFFTAPRFWAEEGASYFIYAFENGFWQTLSWSEFGYLNLWAKIAALAASRLVALENAPLVTTAMSFLVQLVPFYLILTSRSELWVTRAQKYLACSVLLTLPYLGEVWLASINTQHLMPVIAFLILVDWPGYQSRAQKYFQRSLLLLCGLSGSMSAFLTPFFIWDAFKTRQREKIIQALIMIALCVIHAAFILYVMLSTPSHVGGRISGMSLATFFMIVWNRTIMTPIVGARPSLEMLEFFKTSERIAFHFTGLLAAIATAVVIWYFTRKISKRLRVLLVGSWAWLLLIGVNAALGDKNGMIGPVYSARYFVAPAFIFSMLLILHADVKRLASSLRSKLAMVLIAATIFNGALLFRKTLYYDETWPKWRDEVKKWREDPSVELAIWPPPWTMKLEVRK